LDRTLEMMVIPLKVTDISQVVHCDYELHSTLELYNPRYLPYLRFYPLQKISETMLLMVGGR
jgi:hypothetical protein